ncbi:helix-turn-helix transcriptional regulator [Erysipelothrix sp. HDW6C]|uniref:PadR family transcriptional regulator n=1 Tax=Erysipelothrix sp. HDW6C TaxID=2714930 RepID=UPI00140DB942|nr:PadR family transcriptional regulator [Erysipelothrix sp. HDW6C]QIK69158.1 helix-turn-helix transcriptional regulator [Erysipelothrix sp. HDW6C]
MRNNREWLRTGSQLMVLSLISEHDRYGYEIIQELQSRSNNVFEMKEGTLYPILHRMENSGYLKSYSQKGDSGKERKYYRITTKGKKQLVEEKATWEQFSQSVMKVVSSPDPHTTQ